MPKMSSLYGATIYGNRFIVGNNGIGACRTKRRQGLRLSILD